jgi:NAD(P)H-dependent FMN reductase
MIKIALIIGSTRPGRNGEAVAKWVYEIARKRSDAEFELVDIKDFNLPLLDEPVPPSLQVLLSLFTDFENFGIFKPGLQQEASVNAMLDQLIAWGGALKTLRKTSASIK